ncbi:MULTISPECIES: hypothetical protein [Gordonia]|uniref:Uncharacterized protein n=2 Tax=Gordonia terrae TaxID=2055 RepID=A0A2I1R631_9ACTN|nr:MULTISPECIES: hypothetical protein [Gordonia]VTR09520.1 Uncharacterised protein [Clostridioides difficile]ANY22149.1 hypothetical protein BCM27_04380 [Gordonia terrae]AWO82886.1 hypothetical protein DLJ61_04410 [Gordonia terrae]MCG7631867.1 hypothetical protein [Gordonia sp. McavH-238-E]PKZ64594.1 hypothetical protein CYJ73_15660 [Gordonia terrae]
MASPRIARTPAAATPAVATPVASPDVAPNGTEISPARVHVWRVLSMLAALIGIVVALVAIASSAV